MREFYFIDNLYIFTFHSSAMSKKRWDELGQVTMYIIVALVIVGAVLIFLLLKTNVVFHSIPAEFEPIEKDYLSCIQDKTLDGIQILREKGGHIESVNYVEGSEYMPFSSELDFLGVKRM